MQTQHKLSIAKLRCSSCGATTDASCNCGVGYVPAGKFAEQVLKQNPGISTRAIAQEFGLSETTVRRARTTAPNDAVVSEKRVGQDGKIRKLPKKTKLRLVKSEPERDEFNVPKSIKDQPSNTRVHGFLYRAREAYHGATVDDLSGLRVTREMRTLAKQAAEAWTQLAARLITGE